VSLITFNNKNKKTQLVQAFYCKTKLEKAKHSSATEAINQLDWLVLSERRRQHRLSFVLICMHGLIDWNFNLRTQGKPKLITLDAKTTFNAQISGPMGAMKTDLSSDTRMERSSNVYERFK